MNPLQACCLFQEERLAAVRLQILAVVMHH
jgi:hypothetical protein